MTGYEAFGLYHSLKLHFSTDSYNFFKYNGKTNISVDSFEKRKDKYHFYKLSRKYTDKQVLIDFYVSNFLYNEEVWVGDLLTDEAEAINNKRKKIMESLTYTFRQDCDKLFSGVDNPNALLTCDGDYPLLLNKVLRSEVTFETLCILNKILNFLPSWNRKISDTIRWPSISRKTMKYSDFIHVDLDQCKKIIKEFI
jgi:hypothetical protein